MSKVSNGPGMGSNLIENEHQVVKLLKWLPAGPLGADAQTTGTRERSAGHRPRDMVQFVARHGGVRTVAVEDLVDIR